MWNGSLLSSITRAVTFFNESFLLLHLFPLLLTILICYPYITVHTLGICRLGVSRNVSLVQWTYKMYWLTFIPWRELSFSSKKNSLFFKPKVFQSWFIHFLSQTDITLFLKSVLLFSVRKPRFLSSISRVPMHFFLLHCWK